MTQATQLRHSPLNGGQYHGTAAPTAEQYRASNPTTKWLFHPWTGESRGIFDIESDPYGLAIVPPGEPLRPADVFTQCRVALTEVDPHGKSAQEMGAKLDAGKAPVRRGLLEYFPRACMAVAQVSASGAAKYAWNGWETVPDGALRYGDAEARHICKAAIEGRVDPDFGHLHAAHEAWNALARLELILRSDEARGS